MDMVSQGVLSSISTMLSTICGSLCAHCEKWISLMTLTKFTWIIPRWKVPDIFCATEKYFILDPTQIQKIFTLKVYLCWNVFAGPVERATGTPESCFLCFCWFTAGWAWTSYLLSISQPFYCWAISQKCSIGSKMPYAPQLQSVLVVALLFIFFRERAVCPELTGPLKTTESLESWGEVLKIMSPDVYQLTNFQDKPWRKHFPGFATGNGLQECCLHCVLFLCCFNVLQLALETTGENGG